MTTVKEPLNRFEADLLPMLTDVARHAELAPQRRVAARAHRNGKWRRLVLATAAGLSLALAVPLLSNDPLRGALAIDERGDTIYVSVKDAAADPEAMTNDLRAKGLPATVKVIPVSPSLEGTWVDIWNDNLAAGYNDPRIVDVFRQIEKRPEVLELPADFSTPFTVVVGRPAQRNETWTIAREADVLSAYKCLGLAGLTPAEADVTIRDQGYDARWYYHRSDVPQTDELDHVPTDKAIIGAEFHGPTTVIVHTADPESSATHDSASQAESETAC